MTYAAISLPLWSFLNFIYLCSGAFIQRLSSQRAVYTHKQRPAGWPSSPKGRIQVTRVCHGPQMCMRWVGLAHFPLGQIQGLIARGQGSAAGSEKCLSAKFIWGPFILSSGVFVSILLLLPYCHTCIGHARVTGWGRTSAVYSLQAWIRGGVEWWCRGGFRSKQCLMEQRKGSHSPRITAATVKRTKAFRVKNPFTSLLVMFSTLFLANRDRVWIADRIWWRPLWFLCAFSPLLWTIAASGI